MTAAALVYRGIVQLADTDRGLYTALSIATARHPSETLERLAVRILAYCLCHEPGITFTKGVCEGDTPDLWVIEPDGKIALWVEVGLPAAERLRKAARHAQRVVLYTYGAAHRQWKRLHFTKLTDTRNLGIYEVDSGFVKDMATYLKQRFTWTVTVTDGTLFLELDGRPLQTQLHQLLQSEPKRLPFHT